MAAVPVVAALTPASTGSAIVQPSLARAAGGQGRYFGAAVRIDQIADDAELRRVVLRDCSSVTPEIHLKWDSLEPAPGRHHFAPMDGLADFARSHGLGLRGHTLLWDQSTPSWAKADLRANRDWGLIERHFESVLGRYADRIDEWDVINEPIDSEKGSNGLRRNAFMKAFGPDYIARAMHEARRHAPAARLMINDYGFDYANHVEEDRRRLLLRLAERLKRDGVPLDGIGIQAHLDLAKGPVAPRIVADFLREIADLGLDIVITELDVKEDDLRASVAERDARVAAEARAYLEVALAEPAVKGVVTWGLNDRHSWLQDQSAGLPHPSAAEALNRGLPYDAGGKAKPMYWSIHEAFLQA